MYDLKNESPLWIPSGVEKEIKEAEFKKIQDDAMSIQKELYTERTQPDWKIEVTNNFIMFKPYVDSPYLTSEVKGLIIKRDLKFNEKSGNVDNLEDARFIGTGKVIEVGPDVKNIKPGMDIMYIRGGERVLPISTNDYGEEEWMIIQGGNIVVYGYKE